MTDTAWWQLYYQANADAIKRRNKKYDHTHRTQETERNRRWRAENREAYNAYHREYQKKRRLGATNTKTAKKN